MRKKSHILLGRYLADQMSEVYSLQQHRKAFCLGNIMPDLKPSFLTTRHEFFGTFDHLQNKMRALVEKNPEEENARVYWRRFGEVMHYMADYFRDKEKQTPFFITQTDMLDEFVKYNKELIVLLSNINNDKEKENIDEDFSALCQKTVSYGRTAGSDCLTVYKKPQCVRTLWLFYVMVNSKKSYKNVNKK